MKVVKKTDTYTIFQKSNERYAVRDGKRAWINGDDKTKILLDEGLIKLPESKPAPAEEEGAEANGAEAAE